MEAGHYRTQTNQIMKTTNPEPNVTTTVATIRPEDIEIVSEALLILSRYCRCPNILGKSYQYEVETALGTLRLMEQVNSYMKQTKPFTWLFQLRN